MSAPDEVPAGRRRLRAICVSLCALGAFVACFACLFREDLRVTSDKEGRYVPTFSLKELALAMHAYHERHGRLPPAAIYSKDGQPLLSWRVLLLPYIEQESLFHQFKLDEPWDSPHNRRLLPHIPYTYRPLEGQPPLPPCTTPFQVFVGKGTAFEGREGLRLGKDIPCTSYTILIAEAGTGVPWTKPQDLPYSEGRPLPKLGCFFPGWFHVAMADGYATAVPQGFSEPRLRAAVIGNSDGPALWDDP